MRITPLGQPCTAFSNLFWLSVSMTDAGIEVSPVVTVTPSSTPLSSARISVSNVLIHLPEGLEFSCGISATAVASRGIALAQARLVDCARRGRLFCACNRSRAMILFALPRSRMISMPE